MKVYRVEHHESRMGPYAHDEYSDKLYKMARAHSNEETHPCPEQDGDVFMQDQHRCGFKSEKQLKRWFKGYRAALRRCGFVQVCMEVKPKDTLKGPKHQVVFDYDKAVRLSQKVLR